MNPNHASCVFHVDEKNCQVRQVDATSIYRLPTPAMLVRASGTDQCPAETPRLTIPHASEMYACTMHKSFHRYIAGHDRSTSGIYLPAYDLTRVATPP